MLTRSWTKNAGQIKRSTLARITSPSLLSCTRACFLGSP